MDKRRDALAGAAKLALAIRDIARETGDGAVCTSGGVVCKPGIVTSVVETAEQLLDQRHLDAGKLAGMLARARIARERFAQEERIDVAWERIWSIEPILFDDDPDRALRRGDPRGRRDVAPAPVGPAPRRRRGARAGVPTVMLFVQSLRGLSHTKLEDTKPEHLELAVAALDRLADEDDRPARRRQVSTPAIEPGRSRIAIIAGLAVGGLLTWNVSNVGAVADPLADVLRGLARRGRAADDGAARHAVRVAASRRHVADLRGPRTVALAAIAAAASGTASCWRRTSYAVALVGRLIVGIGTGAGFRRPGSTSCARVVAARARAARTAARRWPAAVSR